VHLSGEPQNIKDAFNEEVDFLGANIDFDASGASGGLSKYSERILVADGALNTVFTKKEFDKIQAKLLGIKTQEKVSLQLLGELKMF
jgi:hypothetical protein